MNGSITADEYRRSVWTPALSSILSIEEVKANWQFSLTAFDELLPLKNPWASLSSEAITKLNQITVLLQAGQPIQYIAGKAPFLNFWLKVSQDTLIPRPETEELVMHIGKRMSPSTVKRILDIGTGSGCIAIGLQHQFQQAEVWALEASEKAMAMAQINFKEHAPEVKLIWNNVLEDELPTGPFEVIVSNPPYIPWREFDSLDRRVTDFEPHLALFTPNDDPLIFYRVIVEAAKGRLNPNGVLAFETHFQYAEMVRNLVEEAGFFADLKADMQGLPRMVFASHRPF